MSQEIDTIKWNVYGKIEKVVRSSASSKPDLEFHYDAMGNRICKIVKPRAGSGILTQENWTYTYYLRDASGNVLAAYDRTFRTRSGGFDETYRLKENDLYGSSRTGIRTTSFDVATVVLTTSGYNADQTIHVTAVAAGSGTALSTTIFNHKLGEKSYELTNHLGNVLVTVSDMRTANYSGPVVTGWNAIVNSATDYYAFGSTMPGRNYVSSTAYRYGQNGQEHEDEIATGVYTAEFWEYDSRLGRRWNTDPVVKFFESPYATFDNNPISIADPNGKDGEPTTCGSDEPIATSTMSDQGPSLDLGTSSTWVGSTGQDVGTTFYTGYASDPLIITTSSYAEPDADDPDFAGKKQLLEAANSILPDILQGYLENAMGDQTNLDAAVFDKFDELVRSKMGGQQLSYFGLSPDATGQQVGKDVIGYDFIAALRIGSATGVTNLATGETNTIKQNYTKTTTTNEFGLPESTITEVPLYQPNSASGGGPLIRVASNLYITFQVGDLYIFTNFTVGQVVNH